MSVLDAGLRRIPDRTGLRQRVDPALEQARDGFLRIAHVARLGAVHVDQVGVNRQEHGCLPLSRVQAALSHRHPELPLAELRHLQEHAEIGHRDDALAIGVRQLLDRRGKRGEVPAVGGHQHDPAEAGPGQRGDEVGDDRAEGLVRDREGSGKGQVVARAADPDGRRHERVEAIGQPLGEVIAEQRVRGQRHVMGMLLGGAEGHHDRVAPSAELRLDLGPGQLVELECADGVTLYWLWALEACSTYEVASVSLHAREGALI